MPSVHIGGGSPVLELASVVESSVVDVSVAERSVVEGSGPVVGSTVVSSIVVPVLGSVMPPLVVGSVVDDATVVSVPEVVAAARSSLLHATTGRSRSSDMLRSDGHGSG
jgi:hypothetical protein